MSIERVLVVDDEPLVRNFAAEILKRLGKEVVTAAHGEEAILRLQEEAFDLVLTDRKMPKKDGLQVLKAAKALHPSCFVLMMTAFGSIESTVEAMQLGASNYLIKPFPPEALEAAVAQCEGESRLQKENSYLRETASPSRLIAVSPAIQRLLLDLDKIAQSNASVFITGESGTGKEVIAALIHQRSRRAHHPFIKVNCAAIPETLLESEFFGHEKGSFTGALAKKTGRFELADKGTLLLDEVTEIPLTLQPKLLRAIQEQEFERVGGMRSLHVDVRFLSTSNRNMQEAMESSLFREDLFYRLNVVPIHLPPLREREEDILPLAEAFLAQFCAENHKPKKRLSAPAILKLQQYHWPGNVRELANIIERTVVLDFGEEIDASHLYLEPLSPQSLKPKVGATLHEMEKKMILETLEIHHQNKTKTAAVLGISVRTLRNKIHEFNAEET
jgi:two-component system response regulator AtoC